VTEGDWAKGQLRGAGEAGRLWEKGLKFVNSFFATFALSDQGVWAVTESWEGGRAPEPERGQVYEPIKAWEVWKVK
jgi:hypothetical protein